MISVEENNKSLISALEIRLFMTIGFLVLPGMGVLKVRV